MKNATLCAMIFLMSIIVASCIGCSDTSSDNPDTPNGEATSPEIATSLKLATDADAQTSLSRMTKSLVGQAPAAGLISLKYYIKSITICESMETSGSAFSNPEGCLELYAGTQEDPLYTIANDGDLATLGDIARGSDEGFVDLMDETARATLSSGKTLTSDDVRSYNFGFITWYVPIKIKAEVDMGDEGIYRSLDGTTATADIDQGPITTAEEDFTAAAEAEEAVVVLNNGGSWFRFQNPFVISQTDIDDNTQFSLDLAFNPEGLIKGYSAGMGGCGGCILVDSIGHQLLVPMLDLTPVPHETSQNVLLETYVATVQTGADNFDIRLEFYSVEDDPDRTIYGVNTATLINEDTTTAVSPFPKVSFIETGEDGTLELQNHNGSEGPLISGLERLTEVGTSSIATLHCDDASTGGFVVDSCSDGDTKEITFTLQTISTLR